MRLLYLFTFLLLSSTIAFSQSISGKILDNNSEPLGYALITNKNNTQHVHSDHNGNFSITAQATDTILISYLGFEQLSYPVTSQNQEIVVKLKPTSFLIDQIVISPEAGELHVVSNINQQIEPVKSSQEILRKVPGLFIGQHAGGGKAEQIFLRGFDIDHGTDILLSFDGMPVNMVSHAHGQGYADLHFVIPETIEKIDFEKGLYDGSKGNFATAGYVNFQSIDKLKESLIKVEVGQFNNRRILGMFDILNTKNHNLYIASEYQVFDGPFVSPQNFDRFNAFAKYSFQAENHKFSITASHFTSEWDASGQVPQRAIDQGLITRFGAIDDTEGGSTSRTNVNISHQKIINTKSSITNQFYYSKYDFLLFSNFTFFLKDSINGDQIKQKESRNLAGFQSTYNQELNILGAPTLIKAGLGLRSDATKDSELSSTTNKTTIRAYHKLGDINELNMFGFVQAEINAGNWFINPSIRYDEFNFQYTDKLEPTEKKNSLRDNAVSPKVKIAYNGFRNLQLYAKAGTGFHSNDSRLVNNFGVNKNIPLAYGSDLGIIIKPVRGMLLNFALWYLKLEQEFVYVGDEGIVEPSGRTERKGLDFSLQYQIHKNIYFNNHFNYTIAESIDEEEGSQHIPLAPIFNMTGGIAYQSDHGIYAALNYRILGDRPANEDYSVTANGYTIFDANIGYKFRRFDFSITVENLFNSEWNETQFNTESRLFNEAEPVEEIHFTPGTPFNLRGKIAYRF